MDPQTRKIISEQIAPEVMNGDVCLFIGAGFSEGTLNVDNSEIPSSLQLIQRILVKTSLKDEDPKNVSLKEAFSLGINEISDFKELLTRNFTCKQVFDWQPLAFKHWWKYIFTTNIDTVIEASIDQNRRNGIQHPEFKTFNWCEFMPPGVNPLQPPIVKLHGTVDKINSGLIFNEAQYSDHIIKSPDWLRMAAINLAHSHCLMLGFSYNEPDLDVELSRRISWDLGGDTQSNIWMVKRDFRKIEERNLAARGINPIKAELKPFLEFLDSCLTTMSPNRFIKRKFPHLRIDDAKKESIVYFSQAFDHVPSILHKRSQARIVDSRFLTGEFPDWYFIAKSVPAEFDYLEDIKNQLIKKISSLSEPGVLGVIISGSTASGKTTLCKQLLRRLIDIETSVYEFSSAEGLVSEKTFDAIKEMPGNVTLYFDNAVDQFYAIDELIRKFLGRQVKGKLILVIEERTVNWERDRHHLTYFIDNPSNLIPFTVPTLSKENASVLLDTLQRLGMGGIILGDKTQPEAISLICDKEKGYKGDLLATLCDIITGHSFSQYIQEDYEEIQDELSRKIYTLLAIVSAAKRSIPIVYLAEIFNLKIHALLHIIQTNLNGKIYMRDNSNEISSRHSVIAIQHLKQFDDIRIKKELTILLMECLAKKFSVQDIKNHPAPFRLYKNVISHQFLRDVVFLGSPRVIEDVYSECQQLFPQDGMYWIQYGRFLHSEQRLDEAIHCYQKGTSIFDSFHGRLSLGQCLLQRYAQGGCKSLEDFESGVKLLQGEITSRGAQDPYPHTTLGDCLIRIYSSCPVEDIAKLLKEVINDGMRYHRRNAAFNDVVHRYYDSINR